MPETNLPITSREYKLMLNPLCFRDKGASIDEFGLLIDSLARRSGATLVAAQNKNEERTTWYLDTAENALRKFGCCLRLRQESESKTKVTLKFRDSDRYIAASRNVAAMNGKDKFEEDILPTSSKFSRSCSIEFDREPALATVGDAVGLFRGLSDLQLAPDCRLVLVGDSKFKEIMHKLGQFSFESGWIVNACLNFWYPPIDDKKIVTPLAAEFCFDYDLPKAEKEGTNFLEKFPLATVEGSRRLFLAVQQLGVWVDRSGTTKTDLAYGNA